MRKHAHVGEMVLGVGERYGRLRIIASIYLPPAGHSKSKIFLLCFFAGLFLYSIVSTKCRPETEGNRSARGSSKQLLYRHRTKGHYECIDSRSQAHTVKLQNIIAFPEVEV